MSQCHPPRRAPVGAIARQSVEERNMNKLPAGAGTCSRPPPSRWESVPGNHPAGTSHDVAGVGGATASHGRHQGAKTHIASYVQQGDVFLFEPASSASCWVCPRTTESWIPLALSRKRALAKFTHRRHPDTSLSALGKRHPGGTASSVVLRPWWPITPQYDP